MLNCHQATRLLSEAQDRPLTLAERVRLRLHTMMCASCHTFGKQMDTLRRAMRGFAKRRDDGH